MSCYHPQTNCMCALYRQKVYDNPPSLYCVVKTQLPQQHQFIVCYCKVHLAAVCTLTWTMWMCKCGCIQIDTTACILLYSKLLLFVVCMASWPSYLRIQWQLTYGLLCRHELSNCLHSHKFFLPLHPYAVMYRLGDMYGYQQTLCKGLNCWYAWANSISLYCSMDYACIIKCVAGFLNHGLCWCVRILLGNLLFWRFILPCDDVSGQLIWRS